MTKELLFNIFVIACAVTFYIVSIIIKLGIKRQSGLETLLMTVCIFFVPPVCWLCGEHPLGFIVGGLAAFAVTLQLFFPARKYISVPKFPTALIKEAKYSQYLLISGAIMGIVELLWLPAADLAANLSAGNGLMLFVIPTLLPAMMIDFAMPYNTAHNAGLIAALLLSQFYITASILRLLPYLAASKGKRVFFGVLSFIPIVNFAVSLIVQSKIKKQ